MASRTSRLTAVVLFACASTGQAAWPVGCDDLSGGQINFNVDWQTRIKPLFQGGAGGVDCSNCHNSLDGNPPLDLTDNQVDSHVKLVPAWVTPHDPQASRLFQAINCDAPPSGSPRMPLVGAKLTEEQQGLIFDWVMQGALGEPEGEPSPPRAILFRDGVESTR